MDLICDAQSLSVTLGGALQEMEPKLITLARIGMHRGVLGLMKETDWLAEILLAMLV
jgi:hypothetical protein